MLPRPANPVNEQPVPEPEPLTFEQERAQRRRRWVLWGTPILVVLLGGGWFAARPTFHAVKAWQARRLADRSLTAADAGQLEDAADQARDAFHIYRAEPEVWRAFGRLLSRAGQRGEALPWWQMVDHAGRLTVADRRDWVVAALTADVPAQAKAQLDWLLAQPGGGTPADLLLAARDAVWHQNPESAESFDRRVLASAAASPEERFRAAVQILHLANPKVDSTALASAEVIKIARSGPSSPARDALTLLATRALAGSELPGMPPVEIAATLDAHPQAGPVHHLLALELRARAEPAHTDERVAEALQRFGGSTDNKIVAVLAEWLTRLGKTEAVLQLLDPTRAARSPELARTYLDTLAGAGRWSEVREIIDNKQMPLDPMASAMYLAVVRAHLGETEGSAREWDRALDAAGKDPEKLLALGMFASRQGAQDVGDSALGAAMAASPALRAPYIARYQLALARGKTSVAKDLVTDVLQRWARRPCHWRGGTLPAVAPRSGRGNRRCHRERDGRSTRAGPCQLAVENQPGTGPLAAESGCRCPGCLDRQGSGNERSRPWSRPGGAGASTGGLRGGARSQQ